MINTEHAYIEAGYQAGKAVRMGRQHIAETWMQWFKAALKDEKPEDRELCQRLWGRGFRDVT